MTPSITKATDSGTPNFNSHISTSSTDLPGFLALPFDIVPEIFAYLGKDDCLICMTVCRSWYNIVPQYAQSVWTTLCFGANDIGKQSKLLIRCLGDHVKHVALDKLQRETDVYYMMNNLLEWGCSKIRSLELNGCQTNNQDAFLNVLTKLAPHLTHLKMLDHRSNIAFLHVLNACPQLTHLTYQNTPEFVMEEDLGVYDTEPEVREAESCIKTFPEITHLCLDAMLNRRLRLDPILKRCPNLRTFIGPSLVSGDLDDDMSYNSISIDFDLLFDACSKITCIKDAFSYGSLQDLDHPTINADNDEFNGLRHFSVTNICQRDSVIRRLTESQHTLEYLSIRALDNYDNNIDWSSLLKSLQLTQLQTLTLRHTHIDSATIFLICNQCPALEKLDLVSNGLTFDPSVIQRLHPMNQLRSLKLYRISFEDGLSLVEILERLPSLENLFVCYLTIPVKFPEGIKCPRQLKKLQLAGIKWTNGNEAVDLNEGPARLFEWFAHHSNVESIALYAISNFGTWSLPALASISTLKTLDLELEDELECGAAEEENLNQFASLLSATVIEKMYIETWWHLPHEAVSKLKRLPLLENLKAYHRWENSCCKLLDPLQMEKDDPDLKEWMSQMDMYNQIRSQELNTYRKIPSL